jgi:arginase family enzyme
VVIDPLERWREHGEKPDYAGLLTFAGAPYTQDPGELAGVDWPGEQEFAWQRERGITSFFMHDVRDLGISEVVERTVELVGDGPVFLSVDVDVLDPGFAPGTGTPEPGGMTAVDLLWAVRSVAERLELVGADVVEVCPQAIGSLDPTALVAERTVREILTGIALRRQAR